MSRETVSRQQAHFSFGYFIEAGLLGEFVSIKPNEIARKQNAL